MMRKLSRQALIAAALLLCPGILAAETTARLSIRADRPEALCQKGEAATFLVELTQGDKPASAPNAECELSTNAFWQAEKSQITIADGKAHVTARRDHPCILWVRITYRAEGEQPLQSVAGVGFGPEEIAPSMPPPEDFDEFWSQQKQRVDEIPPAPVLELMDSGQQSVELFRIALDNINDTKIHGYLAKPKGDGPFPAFLQLQWAGVYSLDPAWAVGRAQQGFLALNINAHAIENGRSAECYKALQEGALKDYPYQGRDNRETCYFLRMYLSCYRAAEYLASRADWDRRHLVACGDSQGGGQAIVTAAVSPHVTAVAAGVPAMCDLTAMVAARAPGWPMIVAVKDGKPDSAQLEVARYFDVVSFARKVKVPAIVGTGFADLTCPASSVYAAFNVLQGPKTMVLDPLADHVQGKPNWWRESGAFVLEHAKD